MHFTPTYHEHVARDNVGRWRRVGAAGAGPPVVLRQTSAQVAGANFLLMNTKRRGGGWKEGVNFVMRV